MRKPIATGLLAILVIGVVAFFLTRPKEGTLEYHLSEYLTLQRQISQGTPMERTRNIVNRVLRKPSYVGLSVHHFVRLEEHRRALIDLGYLEQREFALSNRSAIRVVDEHNALIAADPRGKTYRREFLEVVTPGTNRIVVTARRKDMPLSAEAIRKADVP